MALELRTVDAAEAKAALNPDAVKSALRSAFAGLATDRNVQPAQSVTEFPDGEGDCIFYPGLLYDLDLVGMKISPFISALGKAGKPPLTAYTLLLSATTGEPVLLCDSLALTTARTAATTALALEYLTPPDARHLALIGTGPVGLEHLRYVAEQHPWSDIRVWSASVVDAAGAREKQSMVDETSVSARVVEDVQQAVADADVVMLCTASTSPVIDIDALKPTATITSVGTNGVRAHEIDPSALSSMGVYCDYRATAPVTAWEMIIAQEAGWTADSIIADLPELVSAGDGPHLPDGRIFFRSTGLGIEDLAIASLLR